MGSIHFLLPRRQEVIDLAVGCGYLTGHDNSPWYTRIQVHERGLTASRATRESGRLVTPWPVKGQGGIALSTSTLLPRDEPYHLTLELCRGTLARIHRQIDWPVLMDPKLQPLLDQAQAGFIAASLAPRDSAACDEAAESSIEFSLKLIRECLGDTAAGNKQPSFSSRLTGFQVRSRSELKQLARDKTWPGNAVFCQSSWRDVEANPGEWDFSSWAKSLRQIRASRRRTAAGPIFRLDRRELPDWLYLWEDDFEAMTSYLTSYVRAAVKHLRDWVNVWYVTAGTNVESELHLDEEHRLRMTLSALEVLRQEDPQTPVIVGIRQPWGEYLGHSEVDLSPLQFADIILRSSLGVSGFALEMNVACSAARTLPRDLLEYHQLLHAWSQLGLPLVVLLTQPNSIEAQSTTKLAVRDIRDLGQLLQHRPAVQGVIWGQLTDESDWPAGIFTVAGERKPLADELARLWSQSRPEGD